MYSLNCRGKLFTIDEPIVMGIINATPDSFYAASRKAGDEIIYSAEQMVEEGAAILDVGGQSTRPGSSRLDAEEELRRVIPAIEAIHKRFPEQIISVDTYYARVAEAGIQSGASIVNDVSAGIIDEELLPMVSKLQVPYVLMHMAGHPQTMQDAPHYENVTLEVFDFLSFRIAELLTMGINDIIIDPGFGFGKTADHNFTLLKQLAYFNKLDKPLLVGLSRKATICKTLNIGVSESLNGTTVMNTIALMNGATILRVHDVRPAVEAVKLYKACSK